MHRKIRLFGIGLCLLGQLTMAQDQKKPNILLVVVDDMGYGDLSSYGSTQVATPNIDRLAKEGVKFTQGYVSSTVCAPSRAGLLTGRYQNKFGFETNLIGKPKYNLPEGMGIPPEEKLVPQYLKEQDYRTAIVGKWHVGQSADFHLPNNRGFDYFFGMLNGNHTYFPTPRRNRLKRNSENVTKIDEPYLTDWFTSEAIQFIGNGNAEPWFLYLAYNTPHTPLQAKEEDLAKFSHITNNKRRTYLAMQHNLDQNMGRILSHLESTGQKENTLIVFISDNGGPVSANASLNAPLRGEKSTVLEGGFRVPFMVSWPARIQGGKVYNKPVISLDLLPTFLAAAGAGPEASRGKDLDGVDLLPYLDERQNESPHKTLYWRMIMRGSAIQEDGWKLIRLDHRAPQLYYLPDDISELNDLAAANPEKVNYLMGKLHQWEYEEAAVPIWLGSRSWMEGNRKKYDQSYQLEQPKKN